MSDIRCPICNGELSYCGEQNSDGPTLDCLVCRLREEIERLRDLLAAGDREKCCEQVKEQYRQEIERLQHALRACHGGCRMLSQGDDCDDDCDCGLCKRDREIDRLRQAIKQLAYDHPLISVSWPHRGKTYFRTIDDWASFVLYEAEGGGG